jgi:hypothetical protein
LEVVTDKFRIEVTQSQLHTNLDYTYYWGGYSPLAP